ncbi:hypothetical protein ACFFF7_07785 [Novosphingobium aquiterrae]|uniref:Uncharacterized protein n=1 Tax=Novosphingobium aquiterrae TaxID=624388 RepID=A0ABV6PHM0_9SPHN
MGERIGLIVGTSLIASLLAIGGCADRSNSEQANSAFTQADADKITASCRVPSSLVVVSGEQVTIQPANNIPMEAFSCVLEGIRKAGVQNFGFIGNAALPDERK